MDDNTAQAIVLCVLFGGIALTLMVFAIASAAVRRAEERTRQLQLQIKADKTVAVTELPEYALKRTWTEPEEG